MGLTTPEDIGTDLDDEDDNDYVVDHEGNDEGCSSSSTASDTSNDSRHERGQRQRPPRPTFVSVEAYRARVGEERYCLETMTAARRPDWWDAGTRVSSGSRSSVDHEDE